jgi:hypothetical protein
MCSFIGIVVLAFAAQAYAPVSAANQMGDAQRPMDELLDSLANNLVDRLLFDRAFKASRRHTDLGNSTLGKPFGSYDHNQDHGQTESKHTQPLARFSTLPKSVPWPVEEFGMEAANEDAEEAAMAASEAMDFRREASAAQATAATAAMAGANRPGQWSSGFVLHHQETPSETSQSDHSDEEIPAEHVLPVPPLDLKLVDKMLDRLTVFKASRLHHTDLDTSTLGKPFGGHEAAAAIVTATTAAVTAAASRPARNDHNQDQGQVDLRRTPKSVPWPVEEFGMEPANEEDAAIAANEARDASTDAATAAAEAAAEAAFLHHQEAETTQSDRSDTEDIPADPAVHFPVPHEGGDTSSEP